MADGNVKITDKEGNLLLSKRATFDKVNELITTYDETELILIEGYELISKNIFYNTDKKILNSNEKSIFKDTEGNIVESTMFQYDIRKNLFSSIGEIKVKDILKNKYFFKEIHVDTKKKEMIGSDISVVLDQKNFGLTQENDPRFVANDIFVSKNITNLSKGVFTVCKLKEDKCPPWSIKAKNIIHDKLKKTIYYKKATLKIYDIPIFYFPRFFHPDPTVKRQSGFLPPIFSLSSSLGTGSATPYYWALSKNKDLTFTPKLYTNENAVFLNEYRQAFRNGFLTLDTSYQEGYRNTSSKKTEGSRNHIFANLDLNFGKDETSNSSLNVKVQRTSNDTYFRVHNINTTLVDSENTNLENEIAYNFNKSDMYLDIKANVFEDLTVDESARYEYILPNITYGKTFFNETLGTFDFTSNAYYSNYETNRHKTFLVNDINWSPFNKITKNGFINTLEGMIRNTNYETKNTTKYKDETTVNELQGVVSHKTSLPMKKDGIKYSKLFSPNFMLRYSPGHMRNLKSDEVMLNYSNIYALNKTGEIEDGLSAILGIDYSINEKKNNSETEKFSLSLGQVFSNEENLHMPSQSSLDQKSSDVVGKIIYNFSEIGKIDYQFALDHNLNDFNYNDVSTILNFGKVEFNLDYLEQQKHIGEEHYASAGLSLNFNNNNKLSFKTKKNFKTDSTELYDLSYQYGIDCLTAGILYRREFYQDVDDLEPKDTMMFTITFVPFGSVKTPYIKQ
jgi:LPS-assembly protein